MTDLFSSLVLGAKQLLDPAIIRILARSMALTAVLTAMLGVAGWYALDFVLALGGFEDALFAGAQGLRGAVAVVLALVGVWLIWRIVAMAVIQFFADEVVIAVEAAHYPTQASTARNLRFGEQLQQAAAAAGRALIANLVALPVALVLLITGIGPALVFLAVNAGLLGRELQDMVWLRHRAGRDDPAPLRRREKFMLGGFVAGLMMVPFVQFLSPVLGAASAAHLVHRRMLSAKG